MGHAPHHGHIQLGHVAKLIGIVRFGEDCFRKVLPHFGHIDINSQCELDIANMVTAEINMHQSRHGGVIGRILVKLHTLNQG